MHAASDASPIVLRTETPMATWLVVGMAGFFVVATLVLAIVAGVEGFAADNPLTWMFAGFAGMTVLLVFASVTLVRRQRYYGPSKLIISALPNGPDRQFTALIECSPRVEQHREVRIKLREIEHTRRPRSMQRDEDEGHTTTHQHTRWTKQTTVPSDAFDTDTQRCTVPFAIECPGDPPSPDTDRKWTNWQVEAKADDLRPAYFATFTFNRHGDMIGQFQQMMAQAKT